MSAIETVSAPHDAHGHDHGGDHPSYLAHHFESLEQQFDAGKIGIWVFLVTEILFFGGLFCAYTLFRYLHPEIFQIAHQFLDKVLGGINTVVLLLSSLTMALAVRGAQLQQRRVVLVNLMITMICAAVFLGIKAVEYSHKWDQYIWVRSYFNYTGAHKESVGLAHSLGVSNYLVWLSIMPLALIVLFTLAAIVFRVRGRVQLAGFSLAVVIMLGGYFLGVVGGQLYMNATGGGTGGHHAVAHDVDTHAAEGAAAAVTAEHGPSGAVPKSVGIFFSIYYCMTGLHACHVMGGMVALSWLFYRTLFNHWKPGYFGPVDFVGLYWHLVDLIWIYLFPLLYLIK